jgi:uncharacterized protein with gpF-like domain
MISPIYLLMYRQLYNKYRKKYRVIIKRELDKQCRQILKGEEPDQEGLKRAIRSLHQGAGQQMARYTYDKVLRSAGMKQDLTPQQRWAIVIKMLLEKGLDADMKEITDTTKETMRKILTKGMQEGWSINDMMKELEKLGINAYRAELIARTETTRAANQGALLGAVSTGLQTVKEWISVNDNRTRTLAKDQFDHLNMDKVQVPVDDLFKVQGRKGDKDMEFPGDPAGGPGNTCNCRCTVGFEVVRDENDRPMEITGGLRGVSGEMFSLWNNSVLLQIQRGFYEAVSM